MLYVQSQLKFKDHIITENRYISKLKQEKYLQLRAKRVCTWIVVLLAVQKDLKERQFWHREEEELGRDWENPKMGLWKDWKERFLVWNWGDLGIEMWTSREGVQREHWLERGSAAMGLERFLEFSCLIFNSCFLHRGYIYRERYRDRASFYFK